MPQNWARTHLGGVVGVRLIKELRGEEAIKMDEELTNKKMITTTRMFGQPVRQLCDVKEAIATYTSRAAEKLRRQRSSAKTIYVFVVPKVQRDNETFSHGPMVGHHISLPCATSVTSQLIKHALQLTERLFEPGKEYKKAGVILSGLEPDETIQGNLFGSHVKNSQRFLMDIVDNLNFSMRNDILKFASSGTEKNWKMRQELRSPRYTTRWKELREVK
jgi:DNA polymerase V